jgi:hypothetical protein
LFEEWQNIPQGPYKVSVSHCHGRVINADEAHDRPVSVSVTETAFFTHPSLIFSSILGAS